MSPEESVPDEGATCTYFFMMHWKNYRVLQIQYGGPCSVFEAEDRERGKSQTPGFEICALWRTDETS